MPRRVFSDFGLCKAALGEYTPLIEKHAVSLSGSLTQKKPFHLLLMSVTPRNRMEGVYIGRDTALQLTADSGFEQRGRLEQGVGLIRANVSDAAGQTLTVPLRLASVTGVDTRPRISSEMTDPVAFVRATLANASNAGQLHTQEERRHFGSSGVV